MKAIELLPPRTEIKLELLPEPIRLKSFTIDDTLWLEEIHKNKIVGHKAAVDVILQTIIRLMDKETKMMIGSAKIIEINDKGEEYEVENLTIIEKLRKVIGDHEFKMVSDSLKEVREASTKWSDMMEEKKRMEKEAMAEDGIQSST